MGKGPLYNSGSLGESQEWALAQRAEDCFVLSSVEYLNIFKAYASNFKHHRKHYVLQSQGVAQYDINRSF